MSFRLGSVDRNRLDEAAATSAALPPTVLCAGPVPLTRRFSTGACRPVSHGLLAAAVGALLATTVAQAVDSVQVLGLFKDRAVVLIGERQRVLRTGETTPEGVKLLSANAREAVLEVDGRRGTYPLGSRISTQFATAAQRGPAVRVWPGEDGTYTVTGSINGLPVTFLVDTGASMVAMNAVQAKRLGIDYRVVGKPSLAETASGVVRTFEVVLDRVKVGEIELQGVEAGVIDGPHPREVLLGMTFLERLDMNRTGKALELRKRP